MCSSETETGVILQVGATAMLIRDCRSDMFLAAAILACQGFLLGSHSVSTGIGQLPKCYLTSHRVKGAASESP